MKIWLKNAFGVQSCSVSKETFDLTVTRWMLWFKSANIIILCWPKASLLEILSQISPYWQNSFAAEFGQTIKSFQYLSKYAESMYLDWILQRKQEHSFDLEFQMFSRDKLGSQTYWLWMGTNCWKNDSVSPSHRWAFVVHECKAS